VIPIRFNGAPGSMFQGDDRWRSVKDFSHSELCRAFALDQASFYFDLPSSCRGVGTATIGAGGRSNSRVVNGFVMAAGRDKPVAKLTICFDSERFKDVNPLSERDFYDLSSS